MNWKMHSACIETEGLLTVTGSHVHCTRGDISHLLQTTSRNWYMAYQTAATPMTLNDLQGHSAIISLFKCNFS